MCWAVVGHLVLQEQRGGWRWLVEARKEGWTQTAKKWLKVAGTRQEIKIGLKL